MDSFLFSNPNAMGALFDTIEEISGEEAANLVPETTSFRQGFFVGGFLEEKKNVTVEELVQQLPSINAESGWGRINFENFNAKSKTLTAQFKDTWEHKINVVQKV